MKFDRSFLGKISLAIAVLALTPALMLPARAQAAQQAALSDTAKSDPARFGASPMPASQTVGAGNAGTVAAVDQVNPAQPKSLTGKAIDKVKQVAKSAGDIFSRVPCLPPKGGAKSMGSLPRVAGKLAAGKPVLIVAFRVVLDARVRFVFARIQLSEPAGGAVAPAISRRRHHRDESGRRRRGCARNDEAAADLGDRPPGRIW